MEGWGSARCERAARGLAVPLDVSRYCRHRRSTLAGRGAGGGVRAEVTWVGGMRRSNPAHGPSLLAGLTYAASPALVQLM